MSKFIALKSGLHELAFDALTNDFSSLKQQVLLFDQIGIFKLNHFYETTFELLEQHENDISLGLSQKMRAAISDLEWLNQTGVIFELSIQKEVVVPEEVSRQVSTQEIEEITFLFKKLTEAYKKSTKNSPNQAETPESNKELTTAILRLMSFFMELRKGVTAVLTSPYNIYNSKLPNQIKGDIAQIVIGKLPLPSNETPWEQIIDYRNTPESQRNLLNLRRWIRKISTENLSPTEIEEELEWLLHEFQDHMKLHKMKANTETLEVVIKTPLETLENLLKLNFSKISDPIFAINKRRISLMEAEFNAPGREMAYIIKTRDAFQTQE